MKKLKLHVEELEVETFSTSDAAGTPGTVEAMSFGTPFWATTGGYGFCIDACVQ